MRPLPVLNDLAPSQPVYDPAVDDFNLLLGGDLSNFDTLQSLLESTTDPAVGALGDMQTTLDTMGSIFDGIDGTFGALDSSLSQLSYEQEIADTLALDKSFAGNVGSWTPDLAGALDSFVTDVGKAIDRYFGDFISWVSQFAGFAITTMKDALVWLFTVLIQAINAIVNLIVSLIQTILSLATAINSGVGTPPPTVGGGFGGGGIS